MSAKSTISVYLPKDLIQLVNELSAQRDRSVSYIVVKALEFYFDNGYPIKQGAKALKSTLE